MLAEGRHHEGHSTLSSFILAPARDGVLFQNRIVDAPPQGVVVSMRALLVATAPTLKTRVQHFLGVLVSPRPISTSHLNTSRCVQFWPINPIVCRGP